MNFFINLYLNVKSLIINPCYLSVRLSCVGFWVENKKDVQKSKSEWTFLMAGIPLCLFSGHRLWWRWPHYACILRRILRCLPL